MNKQDIEQALNKTFDFLHFAVAFIFITCITASKLEKKTETGCQKSNFASSLNVCPGYFIRQTHIEVICMSLWAHIAFILETIWCTCFYSISMLKGFTPFLQTDGGNSPGGTEKSNWGHPWQQPRRWQFLPWRLAVAPDNVAHCDLVGWLRQV